MSNEVNNKERIRDLEKAVQELKTEDILNMALSVKGIEVEMKNLSKTCEELKINHESIGGLLLDHEKEIGKVKSMFVPIGMLWAVMIALVTWALQKK